MYDLKGYEDSLFEISRDNGPDFSKKIPIPAESLLECVEYLNRSVRKET